MTHLRGTLPENKFKTQVFESTVVAIVFWDNEGKWLVDFLKKDAIINSERCVQTLKKLKLWIRRFRPNRKINQVVLHDNARPHTGRCTRKKTATVEWTGLPRHPYSLYLAPFGFNPFGSWKMHPEGAVLQRTSSWNTTCVESSDASAQSLRYRLKASHQKLDKLCWHLGTVRPLYKTGVSRERFLNI